MKLLDALRKHQETAAKTPGKTKYTKAEVLKEVRKWVKDYKQMVNSG